MFSRSVAREVERLARKNGLDHNAVLAVAEVESAGRAVWRVKGLDFPPIRFEGHYFYRLLDGAKRDKAVAQGLAAKKARVVKNPSSYARRYEMLERAVKIDKEAAYASISIGLGQVMGQHAKKLGFSSPSAMFEYASKGVTQQIDIMIRFILRFGLKDELNGHDWAAFARQYNGPAYKVNAYDTKMAQAYKRWSSGATPQARKSDIVSDYQAQLKTLGYYTGKVDGVVGPATRSAVRAFQSDYGLVVDGQYGMMTANALAKAMRKRELAEADKGVEDGTKTAGGGVLCEAAREAADRIEPLAQYSYILTYIFIGLVLVGVLVAGYNLLKKRRLQNGDDTGLLGFVLGRRDSESAIDVGAQLS